MPEHPGVQQLLERVRSPLSLPDSFVRVDAAVRSPVANARRIAEAISMDQAMAARVLRMANSPLYGFSSRIDTIERAVTVIGTRQIRDLALASTVLSMCNGMLLPGVTSAAFWTHSFAVGSLSRMFAAVRRDPNPERYFLAGLLTTIGRLMLAQASPQLLEECMQANTNSVLLHEAEEHRLGFHQAEVSAALMRRWLFPDMLVHSVAGQYQPALIHGNPMDAALIHCCSVMVTAVRIGCSGEKLALPLDEAAWDLLNADIAMVDPMLIEVAATAESLCVAMEVS
ncbi:MAG: HDOD domain-containing protein [Planctomycetota bacterium]|nr:MAG: HDOD domain-containing protein [Planctomycetota bacterium]